MSKTLAISALLVLLLSAAFPPLAGTESVGFESATTSSGASRARYTVLTMDRVIGVETSLAKGDSRTYFLEYNDRGRGPRLTSHVELDPVGIPIRVENTGHDYLKNRVNERFTLQDGRATWNNGSEQGERAVSQRAFYVSMTAVPEETALLARALLAAPQGTLPLLPEGEARIERRGERRLLSGRHARTVTQYAILGLDFAPTAVWLDERREFFALNLGWLWVVREGWEGSVPILTRAQDAAGAASAAQMVHNLAHQPSGLLVFRGANLFDAETATVRSGMTVVVNGQRITRVAPDAAVPVPPDAVVIDARGKTLLPGLWDMHAHLSDIDGPLNLAAGVTTVRDLGNEIEKLLALRRKWDRGEALGPRVIAAGLLDGAGPYAGPTKVLVETEAEVRAAVNRYADLDYEQIKIYSSVKPDLVPYIVDQARRRGLRVSGHVPAFMTAAEAVRLGFNELQHANYLFLDLLASPLADTRRPARITAVAEHAAEVDLSSAKVQSLIASLKLANVAVDPTLNIFESMFTDRAGTISKGLAPVADRLPPQVRRGVMAGGLPVPQGMDGRYRESFRAMLKMVGMLYNAGVPIVAGTDSLAGFPLHRELELYVEAGIPAPQVLRLATLGAARIMRHADDLGSIAPGKLADVILVDGDPAARISDIRRADTVVKGGVVYRSHELYQALGVRP